MVAALAAAEFHLAAAAAGDTAILHCHWLPSAVVP
jgi:hypothetical protein